MNNFRSRDRARIADLVRHWANEAPEATALVEGSESWTFAQFDDAIEAAADWLRAVGVRGGDRLMLVNENCRAVVALILAAGRIDAWAVIVNARLSEREIDTMRDHSGARRVVYATTVSKDANAHAIRHGAEDVDIPDVGTVALGPLAEVEPEPVFEDGAKQPAAMIYTTGTTGTPKGVMLSHANILYIADTTGALRGVTATDHALGVLPVSHIFGLSSVLLGSLAVGACVELMSKFDPAFVDEALRTRLTMFQGVPAMHARLLEYAEEQGVTLSAPHLRYTSAGGSPLDPDLKRRAEAALGSPLHNGLGMTEAAPTIAVTRAADPLDDISCGPLIPGTEARIVDPATKKRLADTDTGELWIRGPGIMLGYYRDEAATKAVIDEEGWLNTGDLAHFDGNGSLWVDGRSKELIIRSGFNVYPPEVEAVINAHPDVVQSAVVGRNVEDGNEEILAFVEVQPGSSPAPADIITFAAERLAPYKKPSELTILNRLPAGPTGKLLKHKLLE